MNKKKYLKYKLKYLNLKKKHGGSQNDSDNTSAYNYDTNSDDSTNNYNRRQERYELRNSYFDSTSTSDISHNIDNISEEGESDTSMFISNNNLFIRLTFLCAIIIGASGFITTNIS